MKAPNLETIAFLEKEGRLAQEKANGYICTTVEYKESRKKAYLHVELINLKQQYIDNIGDDDAEHVNPLLWTVHTYGECNKCQACIHGSEWDAMDGCQPFQANDYTFEHSADIYDDMIKNPARSFPHGLDHVCKRRK